MSSPRISKSLPLQVAASVTGGGAPRWNSCWSTPTAAISGLFPKGSPEARLSHSQSAEREAAEEAGAVGTIEPRHFHLYIHSKGVFWQPGGVQEFVVKAFLMEIREMRRPDEPMRRPTWFSRRRSPATAGQGPRSEVRA